MFEKIDIDQSTSMKNREIYDFRIDESDDLQNESFEEDIKLKIKDEQTPEVKEKQSETFKDIKKSIEELKFGQNEVITENNKEIEKIEDELNKNFNNKNGILENETSLNKTYEIYQLLNERIMALSYCLHLKIPLIEKCADKLTKIRKENFEKTDLKSFEEKCKLVKIEANNIFADTDDDIFDLNEFIKLLILAKNLDFDMYKKNYITESIPTLIIPLVGHFFLNIDFKDENTKQILQNFTTNLAKLDNFPKIDQTESVLKKICEFVIFPFFKEISEFEWNIFSLSNTIEILNIFDIIRSSLLKTPISSSKLHIFIISKIEKSLNSHFIKI
ncbi:hypothetical protein MHBO_002487 [Bonamia ostreae]|uniref:Uncharacterized protein n=1 Tax=Bonamia ostreae TaxID=126728 RepID=A0ABV2AMH9_9EUKA